MKPAEQLLALTRMGFFQWVIFPLSIYTFQERLKFIMALIKHNSTTGLKQKRWKIFAS